MNDIIKKRIADINRGKVPEGYKKTKVGIVPVEWDIVKLADIMHNEQRPIEKPKEVYTRIGIRSHAKGTFHELVENPEEVNMDTLYVVKKDDFIVNITFAWEHAIALASDDDDGKLVSHRFPTYVFDNNSPLYYKYVFCQDIFRQRLELISPGGAGRNRVLNKTDFINLEIYRPPLPEQQKIAEILSTQDKLIELQEKKIEQLKKLKKAYLQKMFPKKGSKYPELRFKGFTDAWEQRKLNTIADVRDGTHASPQYLSSGHPFITSKNVKDGYINYDDVQYISNEDFEEINKRSKVDVNDILMGMIGTIGNLALIRDIPDFAIKNVALIKDTGAIFYLYLYHCMQSETVINQLSDNMDGGTQKFVALKSIRGLNIAFPSRSEQEEIGSFFSNLDNLITLHQRKLEQEKQKKKALMQLLLTGKVRCV